MDGAFGVCYFNFTSSAHHVPFLLLYFVSFFMLSMFSYVPFVLLLGPSQTSKTIYKYKHMI